MPSFLPKLTEPVVYKDGKISPAWYRFFSQLERDLGDSVSTAGTGITVTGGVVSITPNGVSNTMLRDSAGVSVIGRYQNSTGDPADIVAGADGRVLMRQAGILGFYPLTTGTSVPDGDYGDITVSGTGAVWNIDAGAVGTTELAADSVTFAKVQNIATDRLIGRDTAASGDPEEISVGGGIEFTGSGGIQTSAFTGDATKAAGGTALTLATVNANVGTFGSATQVAQVTANAKGLITAVANVTITPAASSITGGAALTRVDDTNVTLTLGGTPGSALLVATSITAGWTGELSVARGGTGAATLTGLLQGNGTGAITGITNSSTVGQVLRVTGASTYAWGALDLADGDAVTGVLPLANLPTGVSGAAIPVLNGAATTWASGATWTGLAQISASGLNITAAGATLLQLGGITTLSRNGGTGEVSITSNASNITMTPAGGTVDVVGTLQCNAFRLDQTPTAETPTPTHTFTVSLNGTTYRIPCLV